MAFLLLLRKIKRIPKMQVKIVKILFFITLIFAGSKANSQVIASFNLNKDPAEYCAGDSVKFTSTSTNAINLHWQFGDADNTDARTYTKVSFKYFTPGTYFAKLTAIASDGSTNTVEKTILIKSKPKLTLTNNEATQILTATVVPNTNITYNWFVGKVLTSGHAETLNYYESGIYSSVVINDVGCQDSTSIKLTVSGSSGTTNDSLQIVVKNNILTPSNLDGVNDVLFIDGLTSYANPCMLYIYNRWGSLVYSNEKYSNIDGFIGLSTNGKELDAGTYYFIVKSQGRKGRTGYIDILR